VRRSSWAGAPSNAIATPPAKHTSNSPKISQPKIQKTHDNRPSERSKMWSQQLHSTKTNDLINPLSVSAEKRRSSEMKFTILTTSTTSYKSKRKKTTSPKKQKYKLTQNQESLLLCYHRGAGSWNAITQQNASPATLVQ
jgi:hypothetical protein